MMIITVVCADGRSRPEGWTWLDWDGADGLELELLPWDLLP